MQNKKQRQNKDDSINEGDDYYFKIDFPLFLFILFLLADAFPM